MVQSKYEISSPGPRAIFNYQHLWVVDLTHSNLYVRGDEVLVTRLWHRWVSQEAFVAAAPDDYLLILFQLLIERKGTFWLKDWS